MFRWSPSLRLSLRLLCTRTVTTEPLLDQLKKSTNKYHIFQLVGVHRPTLTLEHVICAIKLLRQFHEDKPKKLGSVDYFLEHPEFLSLCAVVESNIDLMDDRELVNILNIVDSLQVAAHSSLVQRLVTEGWKRLQRLDPSSLSTFATCLSRQDMTTSPLMGQIANIVDSCLDNLEDPVTLSRFTSSLYAVSSPHLWERLVTKTESNMEKLDASHFKDVLRVMKVISKDTHHLALMRKCDRLLYKYAGSFDVQTMYSIMRMYSSMSFFKCQFIVAAKPKLMEEVDRCDHLDFSADFFEVLYPIVPLQMRERLQQMVLNVANNMSLDDLYVVLKTLEYMESQNTVLIQKICLALEKHLGACSSDQLCNIAEAVVFLDFMGNSLHRKLQMHLKRRILSSFIPYEVVKILKAMFLLSPNQIDQVVLSKVDDIVAQSNFHGLSIMTYVVTQLLQSTSTLPRKTLTNLLKELCRYRLERVNGAKSMDLLLHELYDKEAAIQMDTALTGAVVQTCQRLIHQLNWKNIVQFSLLIHRTNLYDSPFPDRIAAVTMDNLDKMSPFSMYPILRVFSYMHVEPPQGKEFFNACTQLIVNNKDIISPYYLVLTAYVLALAGYFPKELISTIFDTNFLLHFDAQLGAFKSSMNQRVRDYLFDLNRAVCIEHPEYGVPWFHEQYCRQLLLRDQSPVDHQMQKLLGEIFGGTNYTKMSVQTPYGYFIAFEYILDKEGNPIAYVEDDDSELQDNKPLPAGAQRIAVDFLYPSSLLWNSNHLKGQTAMKKRHLEILGYQVIQIPFHEWKNKSFQNRLPGRIASRES